MEARERWHILADLIKTHGLKRGAEIGLNRGRNLDRLLSLCPEYVCIAVDDWRVGYGNFDAARRKNQRNDFDRVHAKFRDRIELMEMDSVEAAAQIQDETLDLVFIDADHSYDGVIIDIDAWWSKIRPGGWMTGHDYAPRWPGVIKAVESSFGKDFTNEGSVWMVRV